MSSSEPARRAGRRPRSAIAPALGVVAAALIAVLGCQALAGSSSPSPPEPPPLRPGETPPGDARAIGEADGVVPGGVSVFDDQYPAVGNLDPALRRALGRAATDAARQRVTFTVDSGWRSPNYQQQLLDAAIARYGSATEAARWVATPSTSAHVSGDAVDIGPAAATAWLARHGATYGLCPIYRNEPWHYELRTGAIQHGCPPSYDDPTRDPRMRP